MLVSVCIPTRNRPDSLSRMIKSVLNSSYQDFEIIVIDNSDNNIFPINKDELSVDKRIVYISADNKIGIAALRQLAIDHSHGDIVICADDDIEVPPDWMDSVVKAFEANLQLGTWGCCVINYESNGNKISESSHGGPKAKGKNGAFHPVKPGEEIATFGEANLALRRKAVLEVGGFDKRFIWGYEGADLVTRILKAGYILHFESGISIMHWHNQPKSRPKIDKAEYLRLLYF